MAKRKIPITGVAGYTEAKTKELVREVAIKYRNRVVELSPVGEKDGGTFRSNWQPPVFSDNGFTARIVNITENYGEAITFGENMPPSWKNKFRSRVGLVKDWPIELAAKDVQNAVPSIWDRIVRKS